MTACAVHAQPHSEATAALTSTLVVRINGNLCLWTLAGRQSSVCTGCRRIATIRVAAACGCRLQLNWLHICHACLKLQSRQIRSLVMCNVYDQVQAQRRAMCTEM